MASDFKSPTVVLSATDSSYEKLTKVCNVKEKFKKNMNQYCFCIKEFNYFIFKLNENIFSVMSFDVNMSHAQ